MARPRTYRELAVWMNGLRVGVWRWAPGRGDQFRYDPTWLASPAARPLSLSLPLNADGRPLEGPAVGNFFDNLLPDSLAIRKRLSERFQTGGTGAIDLLQAIGRDCVGAVQLLPLDEIPVEGQIIDAIPLSDNEVAAWLRATVGYGVPGVRETGPEQDFRISLAGAQEKTALLWHQGRWSLPRGATPTTHIFKLPLGLVGAQQADLRTSVENEWLCAQVLSGYGLPVAACEIAQFAEQKVLVVERFDRLWIRAEGSSERLLRLPQEDFCQALGVGAEEKYEEQGGPGLRELAGILRYSRQAEQDLSTLLRAQVLFYLLAATDGHAKNFSLFLLPQGRFQLTPLYDVLSMWPLVGRTAQQLDYQKLKLAMALRGRSNDKHYRLRDIQARHFLSTAAHCGWGAGMRAAMDQVLAQSDSVFAALEQRLPRGFPEEVFASVRAGVFRHRDQLARQLAGLTPA